MSRTTTVNEHSPVLPRMSFATVRTTLVPKGNAVPDGGVDTIELIGAQDEVAETVKLTTVPSPPAHSATISGGQ